MKQNTLLAIYGGTFSPPHRGHIRAAEAFSEALGPDRFLIIPSAIPPHKAPVRGASDSDRLALCRLAFSKVHGAEISDIELRREGRSYTVDTLRALFAEEQTIVMLIGTDMFLTLDTWYSAEEIFKLAEIAVIRREEDPEKTLAIAKKKEEYIERYGARIHEIPCEATVISSSEIRQRLRDGVSTEEYLTAEVEDYIRKWHLYRD